MKVVSSKSRAVLSEDSLLYNADGPNSTVLDYI